MNLYDIWFAYLELSNKAKLKLLSEFNDTCEIWGFLKENYCKLNLKEEIKHSIKNSFDKNKLKDINKYLIDNDINLILYSDLKYPYKLKRFEESPAVLFLKGSIENLNNKKNVSIIGSRNCSLYGKNISSFLSNEISKNNINIISGMARGIDSISHQSCINNNGYTCAVMGCGVDVVYPLENRNLYNKILENGCILSEFIPKTKPYAWNFPRRNRIISGLSDLVIIVEAGKKSGTLITANYALEQGVDIMAVPGDVLSPRSFGTNKLIKDGAYVYTDIRDVFDILKVSYESHNTTSNKVLTRLEFNINSLITNKPIHIDDLVKLSKVDIKQLYEVLFELQLKNEINCIAGNYYVRNIS